MWLYLNANPHLEDTAERQQMKQWSDNVSPRQVAQALVRQASAAEKDILRQRKLEARLSEMARLKSQSLPTLGFILLFGAVLAVSLTELPTAGTLKFWVSLFGVLMTGGVTGSSLRHLRKPVLTHPRGTTAVLGVAAGFVVGLSYLIPQLIGSTFESSVGLYLVPALIALSAGYGFDYAFEKWRETSKRDVDKGLGAGQTQD